MPSFLNPYLFKLPPKVALNVHADISGGNETAVSMVDLTAVDLGREIRRPILPCLPDINQQFAGFIWGVGTCSNGCPPIDGIYRNADTQDHIIFFNGGFKLFSCFDGNRTKVQFAECPARVITSS